MREGAGREGRQLPKTDEQRETRNRVEIRVTAVFQITRFFPHESEKFSKKFSIGTPHFLGNSNPNHVFDFGVEKLEIT